MLNNLNANTMQNTKANTVAYTSKNKSFTAVLTNTTTVLVDNSKSSVMFNLTYKTRRDARRMFTVFKANMQQCK